MLTGRKFSWKLFADRAGMVLSMFGYGLRLAASFEEFNCMWELISFAAGMLVLMLVFTLLPLVFDLPDSITNYFKRRSRQPANGSPPRDPDEVAACVLGESLRRAELSSQAAAQVAAAFWAADGGREPILYWRSS